MVDLVTCVLAEVLACVLFGYRSQSCSTMPVLKITTNLSRDKIPADFLDKATDFLMKLLEKDKKVYMHYYNIIIAVQSRRMRFIIIKDGISDLHQMRIHCECCWCRCFKRLDN